MKVCHYRYVRGSYDRKISNAYFYREELLRKQFEYLKTFDSKFTLEVNCVNDFAFLVTNILVCFNVLSYL